MARFCTVNVILRPSLNDLDSTECDIDVPLSPGNGQKCDGGGLIMYENCVKNPEPHGMILKRGVIYKTRDYKSNNFFFSLSPGLAPINL